MTKASIDVRVVDLKIFQGLTMRLIDFLAKHGCVVSMSEGRRYVFSGKLFVNGQPATDTTMEVHPGDRIKIGRREEIVVQLDDS